MGRQYGKGISRKQGMTQEEKPGVKQDIGQGVRQGVKLEKDGLTSFSKILSYLYLAIVCLAILYYIFGAGGAEFHSDTTDSLLWAEASLKAGRTLDPDFYYAGYVPFGSSIWAIPLLAIFGYGRTAYHLTMFIFFLLFAGTLWAAFRAMGLRSQDTAYALGTFLMLASASAKLRELFWGHVIYYSLSLLFLFLAYVFLKKKHYLLFAALSIGAAVNGMQGISMYHVPLALGLLAVWVLDREPFKRRPFLYLILSMPVGYAIKLFLERGGVTAPYASAYMTYSSEDLWLENALNLPRLLRLLFDANFHGEIPLVSPESFDFLLRLIVLLILVFVPLYLLIKRKQFQRTLPLYTASFLTLLILFTMIYGKLGSASWRFIPSIFSLSFVSLAFLFHARPPLLMPPVSFQSPPPSQHTSAKRQVQASHHAQAIPQPRQLLAVILAIFTLVQAAQILAMPWDGWQANRLAPAYNALEEIEATDAPIYGEFWTSHALRLAADDRWDTKAIRLKDGSLEPYYYQVQAREYLETAEKDDFYLVFANHEYAAYQKEDALKPLEEHIVETWRPNGFVIFKGKGNLWDILDIDVETFLYGKS